MDLHVIFTESCLACGYARNVGTRPTHHLNCVWNDVCLSCSNDKNDTKQHILIAHTVTDFVGFETVENLRPLQEDLFNE